MIKCKYNKGNCQVLELFAIMAQATEKLCTKCGQNPLPSLEQYGYKIPPPRDGADLCEWAIHCIFDNKVELVNLKRRILANIRRQELLAELPKGFKLAANLAGHLAAIAKHYKVTGRIKVSTEQLHRRLETCNKCPSGKMVIKDGIMRCVHKKCGCYLNNPDDRPLLGGKAEYEALTCDEGHWDEINIKCKL